jgi:hypothetical protein
MVRSKGIRAEFPDPKERCKMLFAWKRTSWKHGD